MIKRTTLFFLLTTFATTVFGNTDIILRVHGSNTVGAELGPELIKGWLIQAGYQNIQTHTLAAEEGLIQAVDGAGKKVAVQIHAHGSSTSFQDLAAGRADIGMSSRPIKARELERLNKLGQMDSLENEYIIGLDGIAVITHPDNPLSELRKNVLQKIFSGQINNWSQLGRTAGSINIYARDNKSGTYDTFKSLVLGGKTPLAKTAVRFESNAKLSDTVSQDPNGIGFVGLPYIRNAKALAIAESKTRAISPASFSVATEDYALARRLFLYVAENVNNSLAKSLAEFAVSPQGQAIVDRTGFVSQRPIASENPLPQNAPDEYRQLTNGAQRLSLNIRFQQGQANLDNKAKRDIERLVDYMAEPQNRDRQILLFGFADRFEAVPLYSINLSIHRADMVADLLLSQGLSPLRMRGYGPEMPVASNDNIRGREKNRRVEIWLQ